MKTPFASFDPAAHLGNDDVIAEYLTAASEDPNPDVFLAALGDVAKRAAWRRLRATRVSAAKASTRR